LVGFAALSPARLDRFGGPVWETAPVPEAADDLYVRSLAAADDDGRLPMPPVVDWETFPFEGEIRVRPLRPPEDESPRLGEDPADCWRCGLGDRDAIWTDERWIVTPLQRPSGLPVVVILQPRAHCDLGDLPTELATELGPLIVRLERAVEAVGEIGRVHVGRWGDGSAHLHFWFMGRPARLPQLRGSFAAIWDDILTPLSEELWRENLELVARALAAGGGRAHV
jgi:diadenosine tetraphosphate (Ap4A) HIT family hydrolase